MVHSYARSVLLAVCLVLTAKAAAPAQTSFTVNAITDANPFGLGVGSGSTGDLRYCIDQANALNLSGQPITINFGLPANSTITLGNNILPPLNPGRNGLLGANTNSLLIDGSTAANLTIDGASNGFGLFMAYSGNITIQNLSLANGLARGGAGGPGGGGGAGLGGGILVNNFASVTAAAVNFTNTQAQGGAGNAGNYGGGGGTNGGSGGGAGAAGGGGGLGGNGGDGGAGSGPGFGGGGGGAGARGGNGNNGGGAPGTDGQFTNGLAGGSANGNGGVGGLMGGGGGGSATGVAGAGGGVGGTTITGSGPPGNGGFGGGGGSAGAGGDYGGGGYVGGGGYGGGGGSIFSAAGSGTVSGGFGGGGGGRNTLTGVISNPGFGGGAGVTGTSTLGGSGGGGLGAGGAAFVRVGGSLMLIDPVFTGAITATGGTAGGTGAGAGQGIGQGLFLGGGVTIQVSSANSITFPGTDFIGGATNSQAQGALVKAGPGILILTGVNSYTGGTTISGGVLRGNYNSFGSGAIADNAALTFDLPGAGTFAQSISGSGTVDKEGIAVLSLTGANSYSGGTTINGGTLQVAVGSLGSGAVADNGVLAFNFVTSATQSNAISGSGGITKVGGGTLTLSGTNTYTGSTAISTGSVVAGSGSAFGTNSAVTLSAAGTLSINGTKVVVGSLAGTGGTINNNSALPGTLTIGSDNTLTTFAGLIADGTGAPAAVVKLGAGTQTLTGRTTNTGGYNVMGGTLEFSGAFVMPAPSSLTAGAGATILYDSGAIVLGGFLRGPGTHVVTGDATLSGVSTFNSTVINQIGPGTFQNFSNAGPFTIAAGLVSPAIFDGFINQGSGSITIGAGSAVNAADFQSYGVLTLTPGPSSASSTLLTNTGSSALYFNGGSRTFVGTPATAQFMEAGLDLHGQNLVLAGGLFVNNGFVADGVGGGRVIVDYGGLYKGAGTNFVPVVTQNGGKVQAGNSPGVSVFGSLTIGPGAINNFQWQINDAGPSPTFPNAPGRAGPSGDANNNVSGWSELQSKIIVNPVTHIATTGDFTWTATSQLGNQFVLNLETLLGPTTPVGQSPDGPMADFDPVHFYRWPLITWEGTYSGPTDSATLTADTLIDYSLFQNVIAPSQRFNLAYDAANKSIDLIGEPEPGPLALGTAAGLAIAWSARRRRAALTSASPATPPPSPAYPTPHTA